MRIATISKLILLGGLLVCSALLTVEAKTDEASNAAANLLTDRVGEFQARGPASETLSKPNGELPAAAFGITTRLSRDYFSRDGRRFVISLATARSESAAYSILTYVITSSPEARPVDIGTAGVMTATEVDFFRGQVFASVSAPDGANGTLEEGLALARALAASLEKGEDDVPVLVKHLPNWQSAQPVYSVSLEVLNHSVTGQPILSEVSFEGGTEAVAANYGQSQLVIVEFMTPQFSIDNDQRITAKIQELKNQGQPFPTAYRRVGNYSVFVFNGPDEKAANQLIDQVRYEQVVQWLGDDPHLYERMQRYLAQTSAGVLVAVLKSSGVSLIVCLGIGVLTGSLLFRHRRAQKAAAYSDAGGSVRLNLDELTSARNSERLLASATTSKSDPNRP